MKFAILALVLGAAASPIVKRQTVVGGVEDVLTTVDPALGPVFGSVTGVEDALGTAVPLVGDVETLLDSAHIAKRHASAVHRKRQSVVDGVDAAVENIDPALGPVLDSVTGLEDSLGTAVPLVGDVETLLDSAEITKRHAAAINRKRQSVVDGVDAAVENIDPALGPVLDSVTGLEDSLGTAVPLVGDVETLLDSAKITKRGARATKTKRQTIVGGVENVLTNVDPALGPVFGSVTGVEDALGSAVPLVGDVETLLNSAHIAK